MALRADFFADEGGGDEQTCERLQKYEMVKEKGLTLMSPRRSPMTSSFSVVRAWDMHTRNASVLTNTPRKPLIVNRVFYFTTTGFLS
jgi:hypothetical protein